MGFGEGGDYQQAGFKAMERYDITIRIIDCIDLMGDLYTSVRFHGINEESTMIYEAFVNSFFKIFQITASMLSEKDIELITNVEATFSGDLDIKSERLGKFLNLFEDYLHAMKKSGIYDPMVYKNFQNPFSAWQESV